MVGRISLYWHTLRYLKPVQILGRFRFHALKPRPRILPAPDLRLRSGNWLACERAPSMLDADRFCFLNHEQQLTWPQGWQLPGLSRLWLYNLHYFDDLVAAEAEARATWHRSLIANWIRHNPPGLGVGWEPYPTSLRIVNWVKWVASGDRQLPGDFLASLATQAQWLADNMECHLGANHLWANAKALVFAAACFDSEISRRWLGRGIALVERELDEQTLGDGGHYERSPMYHALFLEDMIDLIQLGERYPGVLPRPLQRRLRKTVPRSLQWLRAMSHPDGGVAFFNDSVQGIAPAVEQLHHYGSAVGLPVPEPALEALRVLQESGYVRADIGAASLVCDIAPLGPDYQPGHGHADTLSFELSLDARRLLVNSGIDRYEDDSERVRQRGTAAHNTVTVDQADSSEVWRSFRVARRARARLLAARCELGEVVVEGEHDGYARLPGRVIHWRRWWLKPDGLEIIDRLSGRYGEAIAYFHLHPDVVVSPVSDNACGLQLGGRAITVTAVDGKLSVEPSRYFPAFGVSRANHRLRVDLEQPESLLRLDWGH